MDQADLADQTISRLQSEAGISWEEAANNAVITPNDDNESGDIPPGDGAPVCPTCHEIIILEPGHRGRKPKYHPDCRPSAKSSTGTRSPRKGKRTKAETEADEIAERLRKNLVFGATFVSLVDPFDGAAIMAGSQGFTSSVSDVLAESDRIRSFLVTGKKGAGWIGLAVWTLAIVAPICAHHGLIPGEIKRKGQPSIKIATLLERLPATLVALEKRMQSAEASMADLLIKPAAPANAAA